MPNLPRVVVAMSGGVDSSVAAAWLVQQGYPVIGMMMRLWSEPGREADNRCCTPEAMAIARRVAAHIGIPFYAVDARQLFYDTVVQTFIDGYTQGITPNPCLVCNRLVRWQFLLQHALAAGAEYLATGHYVRLGRDAQGRVQILRAIDRHKDQSYVLHVLEQEQLQHALFPVGEYTKPQVREMARQFGLPVAERSESQDLCFLGNDDYHHFLERNAPTALQPGPILDCLGQQLGQHQGLAFYTIGQRKGLGIAAPHPLYVLEKDLHSNALIVGPQEALGNDELQTGYVNWVSGEAPPSPLRLQVRIRYTAEEAWGMVTPLNGGSAYDRGVHIRFDHPLRDITCGQAAVFYDGPVCLGGGIITRAGRIEEGNPT